MSDTPKDTETPAERIETGPPAKLSDKGRDAVQGKPVTIEDLQNRLEQLKAEVTAREAAELAKLQTQPKDSTPPSVPEPDPSKPQPADPNTPPTPTIVREREVGPNPERPSNPEGA